MDRHSPDLTAPQGTPESTGGAARTGAPKRSFASRLFGYDIFLSFALGPPPSNIDPYGRKNLWHPYSALHLGPEKVRFVCLWDAKGGMGPGGQSICMTRF